MYVDRESSERLDTIREHQHTMKSCYFCNLRDIQDVPVSLFANIQQSKKVSPSISFSSSPRITRPWWSTGQYSTIIPCVFKKLQCINHWGMFYRCEMIFFFLDKKNCWQTLTLHYWIRLHIRWNRFHKARHEWHRQPVAWLLPLFRMIFLQRHIMTTDCHSNISRHDSFCVWHGWLHLSLHYDQDRHTVWCAWDVLKNSNCRISIGIPLFKKFMIALIY